MLCCLSGRSQTQIPVKSVAVLGLSTVGRTVQSRAVKAPGHAVKMPQLHFIRPRVENVFVWRDKWIRFSSLSVCLVCCVFTAPAKSHNVCWVKRARWLFLVQNVKENIFCIMQMWMKIRLNSHLSHLNVTDNNLRRLRYERLLIDCSCQRTIPSGRIHI